jgi:predicted lipid-binding transport protein (Tim44 family)
MHPLRVLALTVFLSALCPAPVWARGGGGCFLPDTPILRADGTSVAISALCPGERVLAFTPNGHIVTTTVRDVLTHERDEYLVVTTGSAVVRVTPEHPFYMGHGRFRAAGTLRAGDQVFFLNEKRLSPRQVSHVERVKERRLVYNLQTDEPHTFFAAGIAVHNKGGGGGCFLPGTPILRSDGSALAIEMIGPGERLLAFTPGHLIVTTTVRDVLTHEVDEYLVIATERAEVRVTPEHPFYVGDGLFCVAGSLRAGDRVYSFDGQGLAPDRVVEVRRVAARTLVYNLRVDAPHTFFAAGTAVHNKGGGGGFGGGGGGGGGGFHWSGAGSGRSSSSGTWGNADARVIGGIIGGVLGVIGWGVLGYRRRIIGYPLSGALGAILGVIVVSDFSCVGSILIFAVFSITGLFKKKPREQEDLDFVYSDKAVAAKTDKTRKVLDFLAQQDASMAADELKRVAASTFRKLQECWQARAYEPMKPLLMPDLYEQHVGQLDGLKRNHEKNIIADLQNVRIDIVNVRYMHKADQREFTALITAQARDYYVDDRSGAFLRGDQSPAPFQEFWTFHRLGNSWLLREIEQSRESAALKEENFVEQFTDDQLNTVYGGEAGKEGPAGPWLEEQVETKANRITRLLNFLVQTDKLWNENDMKKRARTVFADVLLAQEAGDPAAVKNADLFPDLATHLQEEIRRRQAVQLRLEYRNLCVRKVELVLVRNYADNARDEYTVRISAHAQRILRRRGVVESQDGDVRPWEEFWTFGRLDRAWKLKEVLPAEQGREHVRQENLDQDTSADQLQWYYTKSRAN